jgi:hypothetical protein
MLPTAATPICLLSGPRNVSTALMYSFAQRDDIRVVDEPLYGHYLRVSGADHPGADEVLAAMNCDGDAVIRELLSQQTSPDSRRLFLKHMAHHLIGLDLSFLNATCNVILVRDPREMLPSLVNQLPNAQLADTGLQQQWRLFSDLASSGATPAILDSRELLMDPAGVLEKLCDFLNLEHSEKMLHWDAGPREEDGVWAPYWYHSVHQSVGFEPYKPKTEFPRRLESLLAECQLWYDKLFERAIRADTTGDSK